MALIDIKKLKEKASETAANVGKGVATVSSNVADSSAELATAAITKLLSGIDIDKVIAATESYHEKTGKDITATINFLNKLKALQDDK